jgi:hypothetical protein
MTLDQSGSPYARGAAQTIQPKAARAGQSERKRMYEHQVAATILRVALLISADSRRIADGRPWP